MLVLSCKSETFVSDDGKSHDYSTLEVAPVEDDGLGQVVQVTGVAGLAFNTYGEYAVDFIFNKRDKGFRVRVTALGPVGLLDGLVPGETSEAYMARVEAEAFAAGLVAAGSPANGSAPVVKGKVG
jgi:hypothetical protein